MLSTAPPYREYSGREQLQLVQHRVAYQLLSVPWFTHLLERLCLYLLGFKPKVWLVWGCQTFHTWSHFLIVVLFSLYCPAQNYLQTKKASWWQNVTYVSWNLDFLFYIGEKSNLLIWVRQFLTAWVRHAVMGNALLVCSGVLIHLGHTPGTRIHSIFILFARRQLEKLTSLYTSYCWLHSACM